MDDRAACTFQTLGGFGEFAQRDLLVIHHTAVFKHDRCAFDVGGNTLAFADGKIAGVGQHDAGCLFKDRDCERVLRIAFDCTCHAQYFILRVPFCLPFSSVMSALPCFGTNQPRGPARKLYSGPNTRAIYQPQPKLSPRPKKKVCQLRS